MRSVAAGTRISLLEDARLVFSDSASRKYLLRKFVLGPLIRFGSKALYPVYRLVPDTLYKLDRPIFVVGCSRSGSSIFVELYGRHAHIANFSEAAQLFELEYYEPTIDHYKTNEDGTEFERFRVRAFLGLVTRLRRKKRLVNKHPQNSLRIEYLKSVFPDARFIHLIRDGRAVVHSSYEKVKKDRFRQLYPFGNFPKPRDWREYQDLSLIAQFANQWREVVAYIREVAAASLTDDEYIEVRYEDFCANTHSVFEKLDIWSGLDPSRREYNRIPPTLKSHNTKWKSNLSRAQVLEIEALIGEYLTRFGYA